MNILSFDIEEWYLEGILHKGETNNCKYFNDLLEKILSKLNERHVKATFFCLGKMATDFPEVINRIASEGHEIGCHSNSHKWANKMNIHEFREDTHYAVASLEDKIGKKVKSYRAPAFSIGESNKWAFEVLLENGIENDASIFPTVRDFGGFPNFKEDKPCIIDINGMHIKEFPISIYRMPLLSKEVVYSGGGYFRLLPLWFVKKAMSGSSYNMCYFHLKDLMPGRGRMMSKMEYEDYFKEPGTLEKRVIRYFKSNVGRGHALNHFWNILDSFPFVSIEKYNEFNSISNIIHI